MMEKVSVFLLILMLSLLFSSGCVGLAEGEEEPLSETVLYFDEHIPNEKKVKGYAQLLESIILRQYFLGRGSQIRHGRGMVETNFYYDSEKDRIIFCLHGNERLYYFQRYINYDLYAAAPYEPDIKLDDFKDLEWVGSYEVNTDIDKSKYVLPEISKEDQEDIELACDEIYQRFLERQETFEYIVYIGGIRRGYSEGIEYSAFDIALVGAKRFYICAEIKQHNTEHDVWLFPTPFFPLDFPEPLYQDEMIYRERIDNIVSLNAQVATIKNK